jgi:hypothetical protein
MLKLNTNEVRNLEFEVSIEGINYDELDGSLRFIIDEVEYGFPVTIQREHVSVKVPPLKEIVAKGMKDGEVVECKLDIFGNGFYLNPWGGEFKLQNPVSMETKNIYSETPKPTIKSVTTNEPIDNKNALDKEAILEMLFEKLEEKGFTTKVDKSVISEPIPESKVINESTPIEIPNSALTRKQLVEQKIKSKFNQVGSIVKKVKTLTEGKKVISKPIINTSTPIQEVETMDVFTKLQQLRGNKVSTPTTKKVMQQEIVNKNDPVVLMESVGMKNPKIQKVMMDKAIELGGDGDKAITETLKKLLGIGQINPYDQYMKSTEIKK